MIITITLQNVINGLVKRLHECFPDHKIYTENVEQGLSPPCFSVICEQPVFRRVMGKRYFRSFDFCIYYYPKKDDFFSEINEVSEKLIPSLELIEVDGDLIRGSDFSTKTVDDVMVICATYGTFVYDGEKVPTMESLSYRNQKINKN